MFEIITEIYLLLRQFSIIFLANITNRYIHFSCEALNVLAPVLSGLQYNLSTSIHEGERALEVEITTNIKTHHAYIWDKSLKSSLTCPSMDTWLRGMGIVKYSHWLLNVVISITSSSSSSGGKGKKSDWNAIRQRRNKKKAEECVSWNVMSIATNMSISVFNVYRKVFCTTSKVFLRNDF